MLVWVWLKIKQVGLRRFWSMFPLTRVEFGSGFLSHSRLFVCLFCFVLWKFVLCCRDLFLLLCLIVSLIAL